LFFYVDHKSENIFVFLENGSYISPLFTIDTMSLECNRHFIVIVVKGKCTEMGRGGSVNRMERTEIEINTDTPKDIQVIQI
jgi:hypothetical protein